MSSSIARFLGLDKVKFFFDTLKQNGGLRMAAYRMYRWGNIHESVYLFVFIGLSIVMIFWALLMLCFLIRENDLKSGRYVGQDEFGNKYYDNPYYFMGKWSSKFVDLSWKEWIFFWSVNDVQVETGGWSIIPSLARTTTDPWSLPSGTDGSITSVTCLRLRSA